MSVSTDGVVKTFLELVQINSPSGEEQLIARNLLGRLQKLGVQAQIDSTGNVLADISGDNSKEPLILTAHMDTVQPGCWVKPKVDKKGNIYSTGDTILGADNKAAIAIILETIANLQENSSTAHHPLQLIFTVREETDNAGAVNLDYSKIKAKKGYSLDVFKEKPGVLIVAAPSYTKFDVKVIGRSAHPSRSEDADNALLVLKSVLQNIKLGQVNSNILVNFGLVKIGFGRNTIPGEMLIQGEIRSRDDQELKKYCLLIKNFFQQAAKNNNSSVDIDIQTINKSFNFSPKQPFIQRTQKIIKKEGFKAEFKEAWGCYDANIFAEHGIMIVNMGYGAENTHTVKETINVKSLKDCVELLTALVTN